MHFPIGYRIFCRVGGWTHSVCLHAIEHFLTGLGKVNVDRQAAIFRQTGRVLEAGGPDRVDGMRGDRGSDPVTETGELVEMRLQFAVSLREVSTRGVEKRGSDHRPQPGILDRSGGSCRQPVHVPEANGSASDHLQTGQPRAPIDILGFKPLLDRPDRFLQPADERQVIAMPTEQGHRSVGVAVYQRGAKDPAACVEHFAGIDIDRGFRADRGYLAVKGSQ